MEIYFNDITAKVKRHLSIIGKRLTDQQGKNIFSNITTSSAEDPIFYQYIKAAGQNVVAALRQVVKEYKYYESSVEASEGVLSVTKVNELPTPSDSIKGKVYELPNGNRYSLVETKEGAVGPDGVVYPYENASYTVRAGTEAVYDSKGDHYLVTSVGSYAGDGFYNNALKVCTKAAVDLGGPNYQPPVYDYIQVRLGTIINLVPRGQSQPATSYLLTRNGWKDKQGQEWSSLVGHELAWTKVVIQNDNNLGFIITLENTRGNEDYDARTKELISTYLELFTVGEYLAMTHPDVAQKYQADMAGSMQSLMAYVFYKEPPRPTEKNPLAAITTTVTQI